MDWRRGVLGLVMLLISASGLGQEAPVFYEHNKQAWVDSVFNSLTLEERIAQLFMIPAYSNRDSAHLFELEKLVREQKVGGILFFQGGPVRQATMCNYLQKASKLPMLIAMDAEWGVGMRLDSTIDYPRQMTLGAIENDSLVYDFGVEVARQMKRLGMQVNFAPVVDVNSNAANPVIGTRSFGESKVQVARKGLAYMHGMQNKKVLACAKHFPGHGDTDADSHYDLPVVKHAYSRLDTLELYPFRQLIDEGVGSIMVAHLSIPELDNTPNLASTLSSKIVNGLLKDSLGFKGIVFTDALNMKSVSKFFGPGEVDLKALMAGNDMMEFTEDVATAIKLISKAVADGLISKTEIDKSCLKILNAKAWSGLNKYRPIDLTNLTADLNNSKARAVNEQLIANSLTLLINKNAVPIVRLDKGKMASLVIGDTLEGTFQATLSRYAPVDHYVLNDGASVADYVQMANQLAGYDHVVLSIGGLNARRSSNYGVTQPLLDLVDQLNEQSVLIVNLFANPYALARMPGLERVEALLLSYDQTPVSDRLAAQAIFGGIGVSGKLPITANRLFSFGSGFKTKKIRLAYGEPHQVGMDEQVLAEIDSIAEEAIAAKATPGAQVLVIKDGVVVYEKSFGHHTYEGTQLVTNESVYDLASITKIGASLIAFMKLVDEGKINVDDLVSDHLPR
ncbi:glycoside hydrolase family 3 N-terminal domain-containing protein, partial [Bacteroidota bacterium]